MSAYPGSQAFNQINAGQEQVITPTGAFMYTKQLVSLAGPQKAADVSLSLQYCASGGGLFGLPPGWQFDLPYVVPGEMIFFHGARHLIDMSWPTGLMYENSAGTQFQEGLMNLPNGQLSSYQLFLGDGAAFYFDAMGCLLQQSDRWGNAITYDYVEGSSLATTTLQSITDSYGQVISVQCYATQIKFSLPDSTTSQITIAINPANSGFAGAVESLVDQVGMTTSFFYGLSSSGAWVLQEIDYPSGLVTQLSYTNDIQGQDADNRPIYFPAVIVLTHLDGTQKSRPIIDSTLYGYGSATGNSFTGLSIGCQMTAASDGLLAAYRPDFFYDVSIQTFDADNSPVGYGTLMFNGLHLPVDARQYLDGASTGGYKQSLLTYGYINADLQLQSPNYGQATLAEYLYSDASANLTRYKQVSRSFDLYGKLLTQSVSLYDEASAQYVDQWSEEHAYSLVNWNSGARGEMPLVSTVTDNITGTSTTTTSTLTADGTSVATETLAIGPGQPQPWKARAYEYDSAGRLVKYETSWPASSQPGVASATTTISYAFAVGEVTEVTTDAIGRATTRVKRADLPGAPVTAITDPTGATQINQLDALGRVIQTTDPLGNVTQQSYTSFASDGSNTFAKTDALGYVTTQAFDARLQRIETSDNLTGTLESIAYTSAGSVAAQTDRYGLTTRYTYDSLSRQASKRDPLGNLFTRSYDDAALQVSDSTNGHVVNVLTQDGLGRNIDERRYPVTDTQSDVVQRLTSYDGLGQVTGRVLNSLGSGGASPLQLCTQQLSYDADRRLLSTSFRGTLGAAATSTTTFVRDLNGNELWHDKTVQYDSGESYTWESDRLTVDAAGQILVRQDAVGGRETYAYDLAGRPASFVAADGTTSTYSYDAAGHLVNRTTGSIVVSQTFDAASRLQTVSERGLTISYQRRLDGTLSSVTFPDQRTQQYARDAFGRVIGTTDPLGFTTATVYNPLGQVSQLSTGQGDILSLSYGTAAGVSGTLLGESLAGASSWERSYAYDGLGRMTGSTTSGSYASTTAYTYDALSRVTLLARTDAAANTNRSYAYDGFGQVSSESVVIGNAPATQTTYQYDGNSNIIACDVMGVTTQYAYNAIDQLQQAGLSYDGRGNITSTPDGRSYAFDGLDRLVAFTPASGPAVGYAYCPDGSLSDVTASDSTRSLYSSDEQFCAILDSTDETTAGTSFLSFDNRRMGAYSDRQAPSYYDTGNGSTLGLFGVGSALDNGYDAYGQADEAATTAAASFGWKQEYTDPSSGLVYLRSRFYNPTLRRFMSRDTANFDNRYAFGVGDPVNRIDPSGHVSWITILGGVGAIVGGIAAVILAAPSMGASLAGGAAVEGADVNVTAGMYLASCAAILKQASAAEVAGITLPILSGLFGAAAGVTTLVHAYDDSDAVDDATNALIAASAICGIGSLLFRPPATYSALGKDIADYVKAQAPKIKPGIVAVAAGVKTEVSEAAKFVENKVLSLAGDASQLAGKMGNAISSAAVHFSSTLYEAQAYATGMGLSQVGESTMRSVDASIRPTEELISKG